MNGTGVPSSASHLFGQVLGSRRAVLVEVDAHLDLELALRCRIGGGKGLEVVETGNYVTLINL